MVQYSLRKNSKKLDVVKKVLWRILVSFNFEQSPTPWTQKQGLWLWETRVCLKGVCQRGTSDSIIHGSQLHEVSHMSRTITYFLIKRTKSLPSAQQSHTLKSWASTLGCHAVLECQWDLALNQNLDGISFAKSQERSLQKLLSISHACSFKNMFLQTYFGKFSRRPFVNLSPIYKLC